MIFFHSIKNCLKKYFVFKGRANRSEFWNFLLFYYIIIILCFSPYFFPIIEHKLEILAINNYKPLDTYTDQFYLIGLIVSLVFYCPYLAVKTRRLHDINQSGNWIVAVFVLIVLGRVSGEIGLYFLILSLILQVSILILCLKPGDKKKNKFGKAV